MVYLDNAATTFPKPEAVYTAMDHTNRTLAVNAGRGAYNAAKKASGIIDDTREQIASLFHARGIANVLFTPSITHAMNQIFNGLNLNSESTVYISPYEHNAVARTVHMLQNRVGFEVELLPLQDDLRVDIKRTQYMFTEKAPTVVVMNALSNVTGYILPVADVFRAAKKAGAITIMDAAQAAGLIDVDILGCQADIICFAGHKTLYGPFGIGGFVVKHGVLLTPFLAGGTGTDSLNLEMPDRAPERYEAASPNIVAISGLNAALSVLDQKEHLETVKTKTQYLTERLNDLEKVKILAGYGDKETLGIVSFVVEGYDSGDVGAILNDEFDIAVRTGYHCAPYIHEYLKDLEYAGTVRASVGLYTTEQDIDALIDALRTL